MGKAVLLHPTGSMNGNLRWASRNNFDKVKIAISLERLREMGYWASPFPEGDGVTFSSENYQEARAMEDFKVSFEWIEIEECKLSEFRNKMSKILGEEKCVCKALVPVRKLWIERAFKIGDFKFWPPVEDGGYSTEEHPWVEYFAGDSSNFAMHSQAFGQWDGDVNKEEDLLRYPLIELNVDVYESDLLGMNSDINSEIRLIQQITEQADRALDLLRVTHCHYKKIEYLPDIAGQLSNGFAAAYLIPDLIQYKESLLKQIIRPIRTSNNWLGLEADYQNDPYIEWLARILKGDTNNEVEQVVKSSIIALRQAFYTIYDESRFLALVFTLDALCSPKSSWKGWKHRTYIAAISSGGNLNSYECNLKKFEFTYTDIRNKLVHSGATFTEIKEANPIDTAETVRILVMRCMKFIYEKGITSISQMHSFANDILSTDEFEESTKNIIDYYDNKRGRTTPLKDIPKW